MHLTEGFFALILFLFYAGLWRLKRKELRAEGIEPKVLFKDPKPTQLYFSILERIMTIWIIGLIACHTFLSGHTNMAMQFSFLDRKIIDLVGLGIGLLGLVLCRIAQDTMGKSWRVGIDSNIKTELLMSGIYKYIRNPTYTGLFILCLGVWLIFPTALITMWILAFYLMLEFQVRCEEEYLSRAHGEKFNEYCKNTKRYVPFIY